MERMVEGDGALLWCTESGSGTPLLLFNGGPGCDDYLGPVAALIESRCRVIRFEPRGCGRSDRDGRYDLETLIDDAECIRRAYDVDRWIAAGHSFGPNAALAYALTHPQRVIGLIGIAGGLHVNDRDWSAAYHRGLETIGEDLGGVVFDADEDVNPQTLASWRAYTKRPNLLADIARLDVPCAFIYGSEDIRPSWPTEQLANLLPRGGFTTIGGAAHHIWLTHPEELRLQLLTAIEEIASRERPIAT